MVTDGRRKGYWSSPYLNASGPLSLSYTSFPSLSISLIQKCSVLKNNNDFCVPCEDEKRLQRAHFVWRYISGSDLLAHHNLIRAASLVTPATGHSCVHRGATAAGPKDRSSPNISVGKGGDLGDGWQSPLTAGTGGHASHAAPQLARQYPGHLLPINNSFRPAVL